MSEGFAARRTIEPLLTSLLMLLLCTPVSAKPSQRGDMDMKTFSLAIVLPKRMFALVYGSSPAAVFTRRPGFIIYILYIHTFILYSIRVYRA